MLILSQAKRLKKDLGLFSVYALATGATLSSGFFLLPGIAAAEAGPAVTLCYALAIIPLIPALLSKVELGTAMPRAGGVAYVLDRAMGPMIGTIGGIGVWLVLILKVAFALIGMGTYLTLYFDQLPVPAIACALALMLGVLNLFGARSSGRFQILLLLGLLAILGAFMVVGVPAIQWHHFDHFFSRGTESLFATTGLVYISFIGLTKVMSLSEEVVDPERNLPRAVFLALGTTILIYVVGIGVMVGTVPMDDFAHSLTPVADSAQIIAGPIGVLAISIAAIFAFVSVANAGTMSASRYPLALSRDRLLPAWFGRLSLGGMPVTSIAITVGLIFISILYLNPLKIAKLASAFQLLIFSLICLSVIIMRESKIESYDPGYRSPWYPWMQILGVLAPLWLIYEMGRLAMLFTLAVIAVSVVWYFIYGRSRAQRQGALLHVFFRLGEQRDRNLDPELRGILKEKGLRENDPFDELIARAHVMDLDQKTSFEAATHEVCTALKAKIKEDLNQVEQEFLEGSRIGATPVAHSAALPHVRLASLVQSELVIVRSRRGFKIDVPHNPENRPVHALFYLFSPENRPRLHLRVLAQLAGRVDDEGFLEEWLNAPDAQALREIMLRDERFISFRLHRDSPAGDLIGKAVREFPLSADCLITMIQRGDEVVVPRGNTVFQEHDRITIIGKAIDIQALYKKYRDFA